MIHPCVKLPQTDEDSKQRAHETIVCVCCACVMDLLWGLEALQVQRRRWQDSYAQPCMCTGREIGPCILGDLT